MTTAGRILDVARGQIGYVQAPNGANKFGAFYGMDRVAWCNQFTYWCFHQIGAAHLTPKSAYTPTTFNWYKAKGLTGSQPRVGALVFFNWPGDGVNRIQHIGIVEAVNSDGSITTIEGNTSISNQGNGGGVMRRTRKGSSIVGYAYPSYYGAAAPPPPPAPPVLHTDKPVLRPWVFIPGHYLGDKNGPNESIGGFYGPIGHIEDVQRKLVWLGLVPGVPASTWRTTRWADGVWDPKYMAPVVGAWFRKFRSGQPKHNQIWSDDYAFMARQ